MLNQKGGSGKTPITINLAGALTSLGRSVLIFDLDGQGDLTTGVGFDDEIFATSSENIYSLLTKSEG
ncbi:MAG: AAA family ATPase, partial [Anaerolineae bacterium]|nr:AAA family ATPase [Anaerolineae bacterium]